MNIRTAGLLLTLLTVWAPACISYGQSWEFAKEKDGIKVFTKKSPGSSIRSFKGIMDVKAPVEKVNNLIGNVKNLDWWDKNVKEIKVLYYEKDKKSQYYLVYDPPWPVTDRDLCVESIITTDPVTGARTVSAKPLLNVVPERDDCVRIKNYWQTWTIEPHQSFANNQRLDHGDLVPIQQPADLIADRRQLAMLDFHQPAIGDHVDTVVVERHFQAGVAARVERLELPMQRGFHGRF